MKLRNYFFPILWMLCFAMSALAVDSKPKDVGDLEVNGGVRKPLLGYIETNQALDEHIRDTSLSKLEAFEAKITKFKTVSEWKGEPAHDISTTR
jgi:hypothetical protein